MAQERPLQITEKFHRTDGRVFELTTRNGWLETIYRPETGQYLLSNIQATRSREGIGKFLLQRGLEHARELQARYLTAFIISRECLDSMTTVFGAENVDVESVGPYNAEIDSSDWLTSAWLHYPLDEQCDDQIINC